MLLFFLLCGRYLDLAMRRKTRLFAGNLASLKAEFAHRFDAKGGLTRLPVSALQPGDRVLVRPGELIPVDGCIIDGASEVDESLVTGETTPRAIGTGETVYAGSINRSGALTVRVVAAGAGTMVDDVERLLRKATEAKSRTGASPIVRRGSTRQWCMSRPRSLRSAGSLPALRCTMPS